MLTQQHFSLAFSFNLEWQAVWSKKHNFVTDVIVHVDFETFWKILYYVSLSKCHLKEILLSHTPENSCSPNVSLAFACIFSVDAKKACYTMAVLGEPHLTSQAIFLSLVTEIDGCPVPIWHDSCCRERHLFVMRLTVWTNMILQGTVVPVALRSLFMLLVWSLFSVFLSVTDKAVPAFVVKWNSCSNVHALLLLLIACIVQCYCT